MDVAEVAGDGESEQIQMLIRRGAYREATTEASKTLGIDVGRFCMAMLGEEMVAHVVVREVFVRFFDVTPTLESSPLRPWLMATAYRLCVQQLQRTEPEQRAAALALTRPDDRRLPANAEEERSRARRTRVALEQVPPRARGAALLRYCGRLGYEEVGRICGMSADEAARQTSRALMGLRDAQAEVAG